MMKFALTILVAVALVGLVQAAPSGRLQRLQQEIDEAYEQAVLDVDRTELNENNAVSLIEEDEENSVDASVTPTSAVRFVAKRRNKKAGRKQRKARKRAQKKKKRSQRKQKRKSKRKAKKNKRKAKKGKKKAKKQKKKQMKKKRKKSKKSKKQKKKKSKKSKKTKKKGSKKKKKVFKKRKPGAAKRDVKKLKNVAAKLARKTIKDAKKKAKSLIKEAKNAPGSGCKKKGCKFPPDPKKLKKQGSKYLPVDLPKKDDGSAKVKKLGLKKKWSVDPKVLHKANQLDISLKDRHRKFVFTHEKNCKGPICPKAGTKTVHPHTS